VLAMSINQLANLSSFVWTFLDEGTVGPV
jgi:hypothetical protein